MQIEDLGYQNSKKSNILEIAKNSEDIESAFDNLPKILKALSLYGLLVNSLLSNFSLENLSLNNKEESIGYTLLRGINGFNGICGFFYDVLNFPSQITKMKEKVINKKSKKITALALALAIIFVGMPLISLFSNFLSKKTNSYILQGMISALKNLLMATAIVLFIMSINFFTDKIIKKFTKENEYTEITDPSSTKISKKEILIRLSLLPIGLIAIFLFSYLQLIVLKKLSSLESVTNKTQAIISTIKALNYTRYIMAAILATIGTAFVARVLNPIIIKSLSKVAEDKNKKIKKTNSIILSIFFYTSACTLFGLSAYLSIMIKKIDPNNLNMMYKYGLINTFIGIIGTMLNIYGCHFIFKTIMTINNSEELLEKLTSGERSKIKDAEKTLSRNKTIGNLLITASAAVLSASLATLIYGEIHHLDKVTGVIKNPFFAMSLSIIISTFILCGIALHGKASFIAKSAKELTSNMNHENTAQTQEQKQLNNSEITDLSIMTTEKQMSNQKKFSLTEKENFKLQKDLNTLNTSD